MDSTFVETITQWQNFYMLAGTAAATLVGLLFVSVSLHIDLISRFERTIDIQMLAEQTFLNFLLVLSFAFIFLIPNPTPYGIGIPLLILGLLGIIRTAMLWLQFLRKGPKSLLKTQEILRSLLLPNTICYLALLWITFSILYGQVNMIDWMVLVIIYLLISASTSAWLLMMRIGVLKREHKGYSEKIG